MCLINAIMTEMFPDRKLRLSMISKSILEELRREKEKKTDEPQRDELITLWAGCAPADSPAELRNYIEMIYGCSGQIVCPVGDASLRLYRGELLFLGPGSRQAAYEADTDSAAVSFFIAPEFFSQILSLRNDTRSALHLFLTGCLYGQGAGPGYLYFQTSGSTQIRNLAENLLLTLLHPSPNCQKIAQMTLSLLFLELFEYSDVFSHDRREHLISQVSHYIDDNYTTATLSGAARLLNYDISILSREIRRQTGKTFTELLQKKRMVQASTLLRTTALTVDEVSRAVGYENISYFHRLFRASFGMTPRQYRAAGA